MFTSDNEGRTWMEKANLAHPADQAWTSQPDYANQPVKVLDHGLVRLVDYMGSDLSIVRNARVSYDAGWRGPGIENDEAKDEKLINYLIKNHHTSPLEAVKFTFEIIAPLFVLRQWHRHRTWSYNEVSARYTELPETFYVPDASKIGVQSSTNKQMRVLSDGTETIQGDHRQDLIRHACEQSFIIYKQLLEEGVPRELARGVLPLNTYSHMFATVDLHNLFGFMRLRDHSHAQYEIQVYAQAMRRLIRPIVPVAVKAWETHILGAA